MSDIEFVNGLIVKAPRENAPDFVKMAISIKREELIGFLQSKQDDWINIDVKVSKGGKWYAAVNTFKPDSQSKDTGQAAPPASSIDPMGDIPF